MILTALVGALFFVPIPAVQGGIVGGLIGLIASQSSLWMQRWLRKQGPLQREVHAWRNVGEGTVRESRTFIIRLLNEREVGTALWNLRLVFYKDGAAWLRRRPREMAPSDKPVEVCDLPPQVTVTRTLRIWFDKPGDHLPGAGDALAKAKESEEIELVADIPGEGEAAFKAQLPLWDDLPADSSRGVADDV